MSSLVVASLMFAEVPTAFPFEVPVVPQRSSSVTTAATVLPKMICPAFPKDNVWNTPIYGLRVNVHSAAWLATMNTSRRFLHPDYGPSGNPKSPYGIPWSIVPPGTPFTHISFLYSSESDRVPYPLSAATPIESGSDRHALMVDPLKSTTSASCTLFETYDTYFHTGGQSTAGSGAIWNLNSNALRPSGYTSADAAGLPILPGLVNFDEVAAGSMPHAIRFTVNCTHSSFIWPARHQAGVSNANCPPMGARFRLSPNFFLPLTKCHAFCQVVIKTMKNYGLIVADNGSDWFFQGTADTRWTSTEVDELKQIPTKQFVAIDESCLIVNPNSAQALQRGTATFRQRCG